MSEWQPIETAPKDGKEFLACYGRQGNTLEIVRWNGIHHHWQSKGQWRAGFENNATHWMPLPSPPQSISDVQPNVKEE